MGFKVELTAKAERDRDQIIEYHLNVLHAPSAAASFLDVLDDAVDLLATMPESCPKARDARLARLGYRKTRIKGYIALFRIEGDKVFIAHIFHQSQDYARLV